MVKKINNMNKSELISYINHEIENIKDSLMNYNEFYNDKNKYFSNIIDKENVVVDELRLIAYKIKDTREHTQWDYNKQIIIKELSKNLNKIPKRGEIWTCELGKNIGSEENKTRPVIIIQNNTGNEKSPTTIIVPISNRPEKIAVHIKIRNSDYELVDGETQEVIGTILCEQIKVVSKARLGRHIATLNNEFINKILNPKLKTSILKE